MRPVRISRKYRDIDTSFRHFADSGIPGYRLSALLICLALLTGCVSYEPRLLVPDIGLSPEDLELATPIGNTVGGVDFGLTVTVNESDSLFNLEVLPGVRVQEVAPAGPADLAGLQAGDVILSVNGTEVNQPDTLAALALAGEPSTDYIFHVRRGTTVLEASVVGRTRAVAGAPLRELHRTDPVATRASYETTLLQHRTRGTLTAARVVELAADSPLRAAAIATGDIVVALDGTAVESAQQLINVISQDYALGSTVAFTVYRNDEFLERRVRLWDPGRRISRISLRPLLFYESNLASEQSSFSLFDFWLFSVYRYERSASERAHSLLGLFSISSDYGELVEEE